ncbi:MAG: HEAT repeat domain-containing protein [Verrucomicrobiae bacterium]|nr:HEAT repeat domain-containing protein [Verrucomicrobiae bacterium]
MKKTLLLFWLAMGAGGGTGLAQNGLRDIPDPAVEAQLAGFKLPEGAKIALFAGDPTINKPVHMNWDARGRLWVVGSSMYPHIKPGEEEEDKLYVLEDADGDGVADKVTVFADDLHIPSAVLPGDGGVYVVNSTELLFLQDTDGDGKADRRTVMLSGFGTEDTHHLVHTLRFGPEGMIWFNQSIYIHSHVETPYGVRRMLGGGLWHFRPETRRLEPFMLGLINPWGHVFDDWGQSFMTDGAGGEGINFVFPRAVFKTSPGATRTLSGLNPGQPLHCGVEVATGRHVPEDWVGTLMAPDFRGHRINRFRLSENGTAGYTSTQIEDLVSSSHRAFRPIDVKMGPDGAIYIADWYNPIIQHGEVDFRDPRRDHEHGRIWRITFEGRDLVKKPDIVGASPKELLALQRAPEGWTREQATAELRTRNFEDFEALFKGGGNAGSISEVVRHQLHDLWAMQAMNRFDQDLVDSLLNAPEPEARAAALRALYYDAATNERALAIAEKAVGDAHPRVRLWAVSVLAQLGSPDTVKIALRALNGIDGPDEFLDFAIWSVCREHKERWMPKVAAGNPFEDTRQLLFAVRAVNEPVGIPLILSALGSGDLSTDGNVADAADFLARVGNPEQLDALFGFALDEGRSPARRGIVLTALADAAKLRKLQPSGDPARLTRFFDSADAGVFGLAAALAGAWKLESARPILESAFREADRNEAKARAALDGLIGLGGPPTAAFLAGIANDAAAPFKLRSLAVIGRARQNPKPGAELALAVLKASPDGKDPHGIFDAFLANKQGPGALAEVLNAQAPGSLPREVALTGVQKAGSAATKPEGLLKALQRAADLKPMKTQLSPEEMERMMTLVAEKGDPRRGEKIYRQARMQCTVCHAIGGAGGVIGPDLVSIGSSAPVDYLVESLLEPSKKIKEGYHTTLVTTKKGDNFAGAVAREDASEIVIRDAAGVEHRVPKAEVASTVVSPVSLMPPGLTAQLREDEFVDLVRFLSELGKEGAYKTPANRYVRQWRVLQPHERTRDDIGHYGEKIFAEDFAGYQWTPLHAKVDGSLPSDEMPLVVGRGANRFGVGRFFLEVSRAGGVPLKIEGKLKDLRLFVGEEAVPLPEEGAETMVELDLKPGRHRVTVAGLLGFGFDRVRVELAGDAGVARAVAGD